MEHSVFLKILDSAGIPRAVRGSVDGVLHALSRGPAPGIVSGVIRCLPESEPHHVAMSVFTTNV